MRNTFLKFWKNPAQLIYMVMVLLVLIGGINVLSASFVKAKDMTGDGFAFFKRYVVYALTGAVAMWAVRKVGYRILLNKYILWFCFGVVFVMLLVVDIMGIATKGASRWIYLGPVSIQPSEFAKLVVIMLSAKYLGNMLRKGHQVSFTQGGEHVMVLLAMLTYSALVIKQPDLGTAAIIVALVLGMYIIAGIPLWQVVVTVLVASLGGVLFTLSSSYRMDRVQVWFDPWLDPRDKGYQMVQSLLAIGSGGITGTHWGQGAGKFSYLPEAHTDFAFAIFCQENGFLGALVLLLLFGLLALAFFSITVNARDRRGFLLAAGVTFLIIGQAVANMAMVCGILPVIGVPLVFISYGGSSMLLSMCAIGLLLSVYDEEAQEAEHEALPPQERRDTLRMVRNERWQV